MVANHTKFSEIQGEDFLSGTHVMLALNEIGNYYMKKNFLREANQFL